MRMTCLALGAYARRRRRRRTSTIQMVLLALMDDVHMDSAALTKTEVHW